jgi:broad specificity phosphatase PhoE
MAEIFIVRHAQAGPDLNNYDQLCDNGKEQAALLGDYFREKNINFDIIHHGNLKRQAETVEAIDQKTGFKNKIIINEALNEYRFSELYAEYALRFPDDAIVKKLVASGNQDRGLFYLVIEKAMLAWRNEELGSNLSESWSTFNVRCENGLEKVCKEVGKGEIALIVSSGGPIAMMVKKILALDDKKAIELTMQIKNTGITHCYYDGQQIKLASFNGLPHLDVSEHRDKITIS